VLPRRPLFFRLPPLFLEELNQLFQQALPPAYHMQTAFLLMFLENAIKALFQITHSYTSCSFLC
jgi:hypothetical protein